MKLNKALITILQILTFNVNNIFPAKIFLDLGDVLVETSKTKALGNIVPELLNFVFTGNLPFNLKEEFEAFLIDNYGVDNTSGLPLIYRSWQNGSINSEDMVEDFKKKINQSKISKQKKELYIKIAENYSPQRLVDTIQISSSGIKNLKKIKENGHDIYIISNWDKDSFPLIYKELAKLFSKFPQENITISGYVGMIKPDANIYDYVIKKYNLSKEDLKNSWFIDDRIENINAAKKAGFNAIKHDSWHKTKKILKNNKLI